MEIKTSCENCVFLQTNNTCQLGRHENFVKNGASIIVENNFPIVNGRFCSAKRGPEWDIHGRTNKVNQVRKELLVGTHVFIHTESWEFKWVEKTCINLRKQTLRPSGITIIGTNHKFKEKHMAKFAKLGTVRVCIDKLYTKLQCLDTAIGNCESYFYALVDAGCLLPTDFLANIDEQINDKLTQFSFIKGEGKFVYGASVDIHDKLGGNKAGYLNIDEKEVLFATNSLQTKVEYLAKKDNLGYYIKEYSDFTYDN